jgi:hypothetical protein
MNPNAMQKWFKLLSQFIGWHRRLVGYRIAGKKKMEKRKCNDYKFHPVSFWLENKDGGFQLMWLMEENTSIYLIK